MQYGISTTVILPEELESGLERIKKVGFNEVELLWEPPHFSLGMDSIEEIHSLMNRFDLSMRVGHSPIGGIDLASLDIGKRKASLAEVARSFTFFKELGAESVVVHPNGSYPDMFSMYREENRDASVTKTKESILELVESAIDTGIKIALENLCHVGSARPLHSMEDLFELIADMPREYVGLCLDTTHAKFSGHDPLQQLNVAADRLFTLHLHDTDGNGDQHWVPGKGIIDWDGFIGRLADLNFTGSRTLEVASTRETTESVLEGSIKIATDWESRFG